AFVPLALALLLYSQLGPKPLPIARNTWQIVNELRLQLQARSLKLQAGEHNEWIYHPYQFRLERKADLKQPDGFAQYLIQVKPLRKIADFNYWLEEGLEVAFIDSNPGGAVGSVRMVAIKKT